MSDIVLCPNVIKCASEEKFYLADLLMPIASQFIKRKICLDENGVLEGRYLEICNRDQDIFTWLRLLNMRRSENVKVISVNSGSDDKFLVMSLAEESDAKSVVVDRIIDYRGFGEFILQNEILVYTKEQAVAKFIYNTRETREFKTIADSNISVKESIEIEVRTICERFKYHIENNSAWRLLYEVRGAEKQEQRISEKKLQILFYISSYEMCKKNDLKISPEVNSGNGPVDFNISSGMSANVNVEMKFADNPQLIHGYKSQIEAYNKAEASVHSFYVVIQTNEGEAVRINSLIKESEKLVKKGLGVPEIIVINGARRLSASKRR